MLVITADRLPHNTGTVLSEALADCVSGIVLTREPGMEHWKPDPLHCLVITTEFELRAHV